MIKKAVICLIIFTIFIACPKDKDPSGPSDDPAYFPLQIGNTWQYAINESNPVPKMERKITGTIKIGDFNYFIWGAEGTTFADTIRADELGNIWKNVHGQDVMWFNFSLDDSGTYTFPADLFGDGLVFNVLVRKNQTISTPAGNFKECIQFFFDVPQAVDEEMTYSFAEGIGLIVQQNNGWVTYKLFSATINGKKIGNE